MKSCLTRNINYQYHIFSPELIIVPEPKIDCFPARLTIPNNTDIQFWMLTNFIEDFLTLLNKSLSKFLTGTVTLKALPINFITHYLYYVPKS